MKLLHFIGGGGQDFVDTVIAVKMLYKGIQMIDFIYTLYCK
jgi:hypothetical protein